REACPRGRPEPGEGPPRSDSLAPSNRRIIDPAQGINYMKEFTPTEAAAITDLPVRYIQKAIDEGPLKRARRRNGRSLDFDDLVFLYTVGHVDSGLIQITATAKKQLRKKIENTPRRNGDLLVGGAVFQLKTAMRAVRSRLTKLRRAKRMVVCDPEIRGGLPVIRGTRIGVYE